MGLYDDSIAIRSEIRELKQRLADLEDELARIYNRHIQGECTHVWVSKHMQHLDRCPKCGLLLEDY